MRSLAALLIMAMLVGSVLLAVGCKSKTPTAEESESFAGDVKAKMAKCGGLKVPAGKTGAAAPADKGE